MSENPCPYCGSPAAFDKAEGGKCPSCKQQLLIDLPRTAPKGNQLGSAWASPEWRRWRGVRLGLLLLLAATALWLAALLLGATHRVVSGDERDAKSLGSALLRLLELVASAAAGPTTVAGVLLCAWVPRASGARPWAGLLLACAVALGALLAALRLRLPESSFRPVLGLVVMLVVLGALSFVLLLRAVARDRGDPALGRGFLECFLAGLLVLSVRGVVVLGLVDIADAQEQQFFLSLLGCWAWCELALSLALLIWWLRLLRDLREIIPAPPVAADPAPP
jgi:hypothetical protein